MSIKKGSQAHNCNSKLYKLYKQPKNKNIYVTVKNDSLYAVIHTLNIAFFAKKIITINCY